MVFQSQHKDAYYNNQLFENSVKTLEDDVLIRLNTYSSQFKDEISILEESIKHLRLNQLIKYDVNDLDMFIETVEKKREIAESISDQLKVVLGTLDFYATNQVEKPELVTIAAEVKIPLEKVTNKLAGYSKRTSSITGLYQIHFIEGKLKLTKIVVNY